jgi:hypothetical protein
MPNRKAVVRTNSTPSSFREVPLKAVTFAELWANYPGGNPYDNPAYDNQCAIRLSETLHRVGIEMKSFSQNFVSPMNGDKIGRILLDGKPAATRADEMGQWLKLQPFAGLPKPEDITGVNWEARVNGRTGIIQFSRYWAREGEGARNASGGHIDLWNGSRLTISSVHNAFSTIGRRFGMTSFRQGTTTASSFSWSDLAGSKSILFWEIK